MNQKKAKLDPHPREFLLALGLALLTLPIFFIVYRTVAFQSIPRDDYASYLLKLVGEAGGAFPGEPFVYRILSVAAAVPLYYLLPLYRFTNLNTEVSDAHLRALESLSMVSYLSILATAYLMYLFVRRRLTGSREASLIALLSTPLLFMHTAYYGIDAIAILAIAWIAYRATSRVWFAGLLLVSIGINEKIAMVFFLLYLGRTLLDRRVDFNFIASGLSLALYFVLRLVVDVPGGENQMQPTTYLQSLWAQSESMLSAKGIVLNLLPTVLVGLLYVLAAKEKKLRNLAKDAFSTADFIPLVGIVLISMMVKVEYNVGRIAMYCFPLYLPLASMYLVRTSMTTNR